MMEATMRIFSGTRGEVVARVPVGVGSSRSFRLMERDEITLIFTLAAPVVLALGDYAIVPEAFVEPSEAGSLQARMYEVTELSHPEYVAASGGYRYELKLEAQYRKWRHKICRYMPLTGGQETSWNLTAYPEVHMQMIVDNVNRLAGLHPSYKYNREGMWTVAVGSDVKHEAKLIQYDGTNILDALAAIAEVYECEWWVDGSVIHLGKCQYGSDTDAVVLEEGVNIDPPVRSDSTESYVTRVIPFGSTRNISRRYRRHLIFTATSMENTGGGYLIRDDARPLQERWFADTLTRTPQAATVDISYSYVPTSWGDSSITLYNSKSSQQYRKELLVQDVNMATHCKWRAKLSGTLEVMVNSWDYASAKKLYSPPHLGYTAVLTAIDSQTGDRVTLGGKAVSLAVKDAINGKDFTGHNTATFNFDFPSIEVDNRSGRYSQFRVLFVLKASTSATASLNCTIANGELNFEATPQSGSLKIGGITVEVLDEHNKVAATYTNAVLNPNWAELVADRSEIFLPASSDFTPQSGMRFRIPQLREALVPASYFTSRYAAMEEYGSEVTGSIVTSRLMLPEGHAGYIDVYPDQPEVECVEDVVVFEDVYPRTNCTIEQVESFDDYAEFTNENGEQEKEKYTAYRIADSLFKRANRFKSDWQIEGEKLEVIFQTGALAGMTFEVEPDTDTDRTRTWWKIVRDSETMLPNSLLKPAKGDKFVLSGFDIAAVDEALVGNAEEELLEKAKEYVAKMNTDPSTYEVTVWAAPLLADPPMVLAVGRTVSLKSRTAFGQDAAGAQRSRVSRIIGYDIPLDIPYDNPVYIIGEKAAYSRMGAIEDSVEALRIAQLGGASSVSGATGAGYGFGPYVVHRDDTTPLSDTNVMSSLRSMLEFASRRTAQTLSHLWTFLSGARFGSFLSGESGAMIDGAGNAEVETLRVRGEAEVDRLNAGRQLTVGDYVPGGTGGAMWVDENGEMHIETAHLVVNRRMSVKELEVAERTHVGGSQCISPAGMVCTAVEELTDSNGWRCYFDGSDDTGRRITNDFRVGDLARCETFNLEEADGMLNNRYYWRRVTATGITDEDAQGNRFCYIDLSDEQGEKDPASSCAPAVGDNIVTMGSDTHPERSNLIVASSYGSGTPSIIMFHGIRTFSLQQKDIIGMGMDAAKGIPYFNCYGDFRVGARKGEPGSYIDYDTTTGELNVKARINARSTITDTSGDESSIGQYITDTANELLVVEYSATGADDTWHSPYTNGDRYMRQSSDGGNTWSGAMLITAQDVTITNQSVEYATSASGTTAPTAGWSTTIPSVAEGQYLWTRTTLTFSDGNSVVSYSVSRQGVDGNSGSNYTPNLVAGGKGPLTLNGTKGFKLELANGDISKGDKFALSLGSIRHISGDARYFLAIIQGYVDGVYNDNLLKYTYRLTTENATCVWEAKEDLHKVTGARLTLYSGEGFANAQTNTIEFDYISLTRSNAPMPWVPAASEMVGKDAPYSVFQWAKGDYAQPTGTWSDTPLNAAAGEYVWMRSGTVTPPATAPTSWGTPIRLTGDTGKAGGDALLLDLDNEVVAVTCDADGNVISGLPATINARVFKGGTEVTSGVTYANEATTLTMSQSGKVYTISGISKDRDTLTIKATVDGVTLKSTVNVYKVKAGADGAPATMYFLEPAESSVTRTAQGGLSVTSLGCRKLYVTGSDQRHLTTANTLTAQIYTNGVAGTETVIAADGVTNNGVVTLTDDTTAVVFTLYKGASTAEDDMLDRERVPVLTDAFGLSVGGVNLLRKTNSGIINWTTNTSSNGQIVMEPGTPQSRCVFYNNATTAAPDWQMIGFALPADTIKANCYYMLSFKARVLQSNGTAGGASTQPLQLRWQISKSTGGDRLTNVESRTVTYTETRFTIMMRTTGVPTSQHRLWGYISTTGTAWEALEIWDMQLEEGVVATEYKASPLDFNYLTEALKESTTVEGGVILSSLMRLGYTASDAYRVTAGMNGVLAPSTDGTDPAIWAGGDMIDATSDENSSADLDSLAKLMFRHNGNGYMCGGVVRVLDGRILIGRNRKADGTIKSDAEFAQDCIILDEEGLTYVSGGQDRLLVTSAQVGDTFETKVNAVNWSGTATAFDSIALAHYYSKEMILEPANPEQTASEDGTEALSTTYLETWSWVPTINIAQTKTINIGSGTIAAGTVIEVSSLSTSFSITRSHSEGVQITAMAELCYTDSAGKVQVVRKVNMPKQYSGNTCSFSMGTTIRHTVQVAASYFVRLTLTPNTDGMGKPLANEYKTVTPATATASGTTKTTRSDVTIIGTDGIKSIWGDGGFLANSNGVKIRGSLWINGKLVTTS